MTAEICAFVYSLRETQIWFGGYAEDSAARTGAGSPSVSSRISDVEREGRAMARSTISDGWAAW